VVLKQARPSAAEAKKIADELRNWVAKEIGADRQAQGHPLRRQPAEDPLRQDHAPPAAFAIAKGEEITQDVSTLENPGPRTGFFFGRFLQ
jgi:acetyl-CoA synthetase